jgi:hypothetical protein
VSGRPIDGGRASPCAAGGEGAVPQELEQMLKLGPCGEPSSLGTSRSPGGCPMCTVPDKRGWGAIVMERAMALIDKPHCSACGDEMELSLLIPPFGSPYGLKVFTCPRCGRSKDYLIGRPEAA